MYAELLSPVQLLLEGPVLIAVVDSLATSAVTLTITDYSIVVLVLLAVTGIQVTLQRKGEVVGQIEVCVGNGVHRVTDGLVLVQLVLPHEVTVLILVTCNHHLTIAADIRTTIVLLLTEVVEDVLTCSYIVQVYGIDRCDVTAIHEGVGITTVAGAITRVVVLMGDIQVQTGLEPLSGLNVNSYTTRDTVETVGLQITLLIKIAERNQVVGLVGCTVGTDVVLLTVAVVDSLIIPVEVLTIGALNL